MISKIHKSQKKNILLFLIILGLTALFSNAFLQAHYSSDTYVLIDLGYNNYPQSYFLPDGRIISALVCFIAGIFNPPYMTYIVLMDTIGVVFLSIAIFKLYKFILKISNEKNIVNKILIFMGVYILIYNQFTLEYLLFPESAVMCFGVLMTVIAAINFIKKDNVKQYFKVFIQLFIASVSYQAVILAFPVFVLILSLFNERKKTIKDYILKIMLCLADFMIIFLADFMIMKIFINILHTETNRVVGYCNVEDIIFRIKYSFECAYLIITLNLNMLPKGTYIVIFCITSILLLISKCDKKYFLKYFLTLILGVIGIVLLTLVCDPGLCGRVDYSFGTLWGASLIFITKLLIDRENEMNKIIKHIVVCFVMISFLFNSIMLLRNSSEHIAANRVDQSMGENIRYLLEKYENENNIDVTKFGYAYDGYAQQYAPGIKNIGSLTERKFACSWSVLQITNFYCDRKFELVEFPDDIYCEKLLQVDIDHFSEDQVIFEDDAMYLLIY